MAKLRYLKVSVLQSDLPTGSKESPAPAKQSPAWLQRLVDTPSLIDILLPGGLFLGLSGLSVFYRTTGDQVLQLTLLVGVGLSYFLNRKEGKFGRAVLLTCLGLITGLIAEDAWQPEAQILASI